MKKLLKYLLKILKEKFDKIDESMKNIDTRIVKIDTRIVNIYAKINNDVTWRPNRANILAIWELVAPTVQSIPMSKYIDALPVFKGSKLEDGFYIQTAIRHYGGSGDQQFSIAYALDGLEWWFLRSDDLDSKVIPNEISYINGNDGWVYADMQNQTYSYNVYTDNILTFSSSSITDSDYNLEGLPTSLGWDMPTGLDQNNYDVGMYRTDMSFDNFSNYNGASESFYFFGYGDYNIANETVLMIGIDTAETDLTMSLDIDGLVRTTDVVRSLGLFKYTDELPKGYEAVMSIDVSSANKTCTYERTLLDSVTFWSKSEFNYVIVDSDFNCVEDMYE